MLKLLNDTKALSCWFGRAHVSHNSRVNFFFGLHTGNGFLTDQGKSDGRNSVLSFGCFASPLNTVCCFCTLQKMLPQTSVMVVVPSSFQDSVPPPLSADTLLREEQNIMIKQLFQFKIACCNLNLLWLLLKETNKKMKASSRPCKRPPKVKRLQTRKALLPWITMHLTPPKSCLLGRLGLWKQLQQPVLTKPERNWMNNTVPHYHFNLLSCVFVPMLCYSFMHIWMFSSCVCMSGCFLVAFVQNVKHPFSHFRSHMG